jgi:hypothetical protein
MIEVKSSKELGNIFESIECCVIKEHFGDSENGEWNPIRDYGKLVEIEEALKILNMERKKYIDLTQKGVIKSCIVPQPDIGKTQKDGSLYTKTYTTKEWLNDYLEEQK